MSFNPISEDNLAYGLGRVGKGCVNQAFSPLRVDAETFFSTIGKRGFPLSRSKRKTNPCLLIWATAEILFPWCVTVIKLGGAGRSRSHKSWCVVWKCHIRLPVFASNASRQFEYKLLPFLFPP